MSEDVVKDYIKAGDIAFRVKQNLVNYVRPGVKLIELANRVENLIKDLGGEPAFPVNISINEVAAHRTPYADDAELIPEDSIVKVDIGVHVNGRIADTAVTFTFNDLLIPLVEAARDALVKALTKVDKGVRFKEIGRIIEQSVRKSGFRVIKNLTGHSLGEYLIHGGEVIPNYNDPLVLGRFKVGRAYAIEPFVTNGKGLVRDLRSSIQIYSLRRERGRRLNKDEEELLKVIRKRFKTLPFCERWLIDVAKDLSSLRTLLKSLAKKGYLNQYPVLVEIANGYVSQFEETVFIAEDQVIITTNPKITLT